MSLPPRPPVLIGTASWTEKTLIQAGWYPPGCTSAECRLRHYAKQFPLVEVDSTYYAMPTRENAELWVARTPQDFVFDIKAFRLFTGHQTPLRVLPRDIRREWHGKHRSLEGSDDSLNESGGQSQPMEGNSANRDANVFYKDIPETLLEEMWSRFVASLEPLRRSGKLGVVLFQFPPWVRPHDRVTTHLTTCRSRMAGIEMAVEFRNHLWFSGEQRPRTISLLRDLAISLVVVDEPQGFRSSVPIVPEATAPLAVVRFHGRNTATWERRGLTSSAQRFDWRYSREELLPWVPIIRRLQELADRGVHLIVNTNYETQGPENATLLEEILSEEKSP
jgi:uncharacterized protein YecE (DUF72 family)